MKDINEQFEKEVLECFKDVIVDLKFDVKRVIIASSPQIQLVNDKCIVRFTYDFGSVEGDFVNPKEKLLRESIKRKDGFPSGFPYYPFFTVWKFLYPLDKKDFSYKEWDIHGQLMAKRQLVLERLKHVLRGDFSWTEDFTKNEARLTKKIEYMRTHWAMDNPVRVRFNEGNPDWERDFDEYKSYLDNLQQQ